MMSPAGHTRTVMISEVPRMMPEDFTEQVGHEVLSDFEVLSNTSKPREFGGHGMTAESRVFRHYYMNRRADVRTLMSIVTVKMTNIMMR
jgi:hypothetical protein